MNKVSFAAAGLFYVLVASDAFAGGFYIEGQFGGASSLQIENTDTVETESELAYFGGVALGREFEAPLGLEGWKAYTEGNFAIHGFALHGLNTKTSKSAATGDITTFGLHANVWLSVELTPAFEVYAGGGPGLSLISAENVTSTGAGYNDASDSGIAFSYNLGAGAMYSLTDDLTLNLGYRYAAIPSMSIEAYDGELSSHEVILGLRLNF